ISARDRPKIFSLAFPDRRFYAQRTHPVELHGQTPMPPDSSAELVARIRAGDEQAEDALFQRFTERLIAKAAARLSPKLARRVDPEDVVQSALATFFRKARDGRIVLRRSG